MNHLDKRNTENKLQKDFKTVKRGFSIVIGAAVILIIFANSANSHEKKINKVELAHLSSENQIARDNLRALREQELERLKNRDSLNQSHEMAKLYNQNNETYIPNRLSTNEIRDTKNSINVVDVNAELQTRMSASSTLFNNQQAHPVSHSSTSKEGNIASASIIGGGRNAKFLNSEPGFEQKKAGWIAHPDYTVPAGEMIAATLETAVNSQLPGMVRAVTTRNIYALEGNKILIPAGSLLIGQYSSDVKMGQKRALISWNRLQLPNGVLVAINSPSSDSIGRAGQGANHVDTHFVERFGQSALLSVLGFYAATTGVNGQEQFNSKAQFKTMLSESFQNASEQALSQTMNIEPTMIIHQGEKINVYVAHDLSFYGALKGRI